ncbi:MAG: NAD-dependent epimerase/dehydratase family protein [Candidatus Hydrogenedentes bacterium]|jgi:nucleoside-diphosphate-sugar epimerase|nr:NAD-dependent epimerase/dehydratase family protein [Candidatus Hydrogenedentota bacterium]
MASVTSADGPVAVTGASGYVGAQVVIALMKRGYTVNACVREANNPDKIDHLLALNKEGHPGKLALFSANLLDQGSYDLPFAGCSAVFHVGSAMGYGNLNDPQQVYDGAIDGTKNILGSVKKTATVKRVIYTSSFAGIGHPAPQGYVFTEEDWGSDNRENDPDWGPENIGKVHETSYAMAKVDTERLAHRIAEEDGRFDVISACPNIVLGPLLSKAHELKQSWQYHVGRMLRGRLCWRGYGGLWNIVDVRDVGEAQALMIESDVCANGSRYHLGATDDSGIIDVFQLQAKLLELFPGVDVAGPPDEINAILEKNNGKVNDSPRGFCDKARKELGLQTHAIDDTLYETGKTMIDLDLVEPALKS